MIIYSILYEGVLNKTPTVLGDKVFQYYKDLKSSKYAQYFLKKYKEESPLKINYEYNVLSLYTNQNTFKLDKKNIKERNVKEYFKKHSEIIEEVFPKLSKEIDFDTYYTNNILNEYSKVCIEIEKMFASSNIEECLNVFWKLSYEPILIFIPNFLSTGDCFGINKGQKFFSISSAKINKKTMRRGYSSVHVLSNAIHEFSHSFLKESIIEMGVTSLNEKLTEQNLLKLKRSNKVSDIYGKKYFLECFDRAVTLRLNEIIGLYRVSEEILKKEEDLGYIYTENFYKNLIKNGNRAPVEIYIETMKNL